MGTAIRKRLPSVAKGSIYEGIIATRCGSMDSLGNGTTAMARTGHVAVTDIPKLKVAFSNFKFDVSDGIETGTGSGIATIRASVEYPSGVFSQILFSGQPAGTIPNAGMIISDYVTPGALIPIGATFWIRTFHVNTVKFWYCNYQDAGKGDLFDFSAATDQTMGGTISNDGAFCMTPEAIIGPTTKPSVVALGDSICAGLSDTATISDYRKGMICRGFPANTLAFLKHGASGVQATQYPSKRPQSMRLWQYASHAIDEIGVNDIITAGVSAATLVTNLRNNIWCKFPPRTRLYRTTVTPVSSSTGSIWESDTDQTTDSKNSVRVTFDTNIRAGLDPVIVDFFETAWVVESAHDNGKWIGDGVTVKRYTIDGTHPSPEAYALLGSTAIAPNLGKIFYP